MTQSNGPVPAELAERLAFIDLDQDAVASIAAIKPLVDRHLPAALDAFYARLATVPAVAGFFSSAEHMNRAKGAQIGHWQAIAEGRFDADYAESANRIGLRHARIGLEPKFYVGGYALILETMLKGIVTDYLVAHRPARSRLPFGRVDTTENDNDIKTLAEGVAALVKATLLDVDLAITTYFDKLTAEAAAQQQASADKIAHAVTATRDVLRRMAEGDLTARITAEFDADLAEIKDNTNAVADRLTAIMGQLRQTSRSLKSATSEILAGATDLAGRTTRQAASIEETSASIDRIATAVTGNAAQADEASGRIRGVVSVAEAGGDAMSRATSAMDRIIESSSRISGITGLIDDIAFQTNLLALNASVEAARAGEAGKGFSVVAVEVRRLAQSAAEASRQIKELIDHSSDEVRAGTGLVADAAGRLPAVVEEIRRCSSLTASIAQMSREQAGAIGEVNRAIRDMDEMTQHNAALVEETNAAIEQTESQAGELDGIVERFRLDEHLEPAPAAQPLRRRRA